MKTIARWALAASLAGCAVAAWAAPTLRYDGAWFGSYDSSFRIRDGLPGPAVDSNVAAGAFKMTSLTGATAGNSFMAWCVDIYHHLNTSSAGTGYNVVTGANFYTGASSYISTDLSRLASYVFGNSLLTNKTQAAAFQLATWEIVNEKDGHGSFNVNSGDFFVTGGASSTRSLANTWLGVVNAGTQTINQTATVLSQVTAGSTQNLVTFSSTSPTPEPEVYLMMLAGLGLVRFMTRRRRLTLAS